MQKKSCNISHSHLIISPFGVRLSGGIFFKFSASSSRRANLLKSESITILEEIGWGNFMATSGYRFNFSFLCHLFGNILWTRLLFDQFKFEIIWWSENWKLENFRNYRIPHNETAFMILINDLFCACAEMNNNFILKILLSYLDVV